MLKLNKQYTFEPFLQLQDLNTSYVEVKLKFCNHYLVAFHYLNTSYVEVKHKAKENAVEVIKI